MKKILYLIFLYLSISPVFGQKVTISGTIKNNKTGESITGATIKVENTKNVAFSNEYGFYAITLPAGKYTLQVSYLGMSTKIAMIDLKNNTVKDIALDEPNNVLNEVTVTGSVTTRGRTLTGTQMGVENLTVKDMKYIPVLFGEKDPLKTIQLLPGIKSGGDGNSGIFVRGGSSDQNLILLDESIVYNASHLLGFFSTFNGDAIKDITVYKAGMPAQYGGRLSSVLDIRMNDGNNQDYSVSGGLGLISSKLNIEGPIQEGRSSFLISGRTTYADLFLKASSDSTIKDNRVGFYDLNAKMNYNIGNKDHLFFSGYFGSDHLAAGSNFKLNWGNTTATLRWNHIYNSKIFSNTSLIFSNYDYKIVIKVGLVDFSIYSQIKDWNLKEEWQWTPNNAHRLRAGVNLIHHTIRPGDISSSANSYINSVSYQKKYSLENAAYFSDNWTLNDKWTVDYGARFNVFNVLGPGTFNSLSNGTIIASEQVNNNKIYKTYFNFEPRLALMYKLSENASLKSSYVRNTQNLHLISNSTSDNPTDKWISSTNNIKPEISDQVAVGYYKDFANGKYQFTSETYYKTMQNQIDYRDGASVLNPDNIESQLLYGKGRAYGIEFLMKKKTGRLTGWLSYTLSKSEKQIEGINGNKWYNARQDRPHDIAIVGVYKLDDQWTLSANWVFYTGSAVTFPSGKYSINGATQYYYTERNGYRMPNYHRLDLGATKKLKTKKKYVSEWSFGVFNAYARQNAYSISFRDNEKDPSKTEAVQLSLFSFVPSVSYNFKF